MKYLRNQIESHIQKVLLQANEIHEIVPQCFSYFNSLVQHFSDMKLRKTRYGALKCFIVTEV